MCTPPSPRKHNFLVMKLELRPVIPLDNMKQNMASLHRSTPLSAWITQSVTHTAANRKDLVWIPGKLKVLKFTPGKKYQISNWKFSNVFSRKFCFRDQNFRRKVAVALEIFEYFA